MRLLSFIQRCVSVAFIVNFSFVQYSQCMQVIWAVNAGGDAHTDIHGIKYQKDRLAVGSPSDYGRSLIIQRVVPQDQILYQTERYHTDSFGYDIPVTVDGDYVLVLKFCEVWFNAPNQKVFNVMLNNEHTVAADLDIFGRVGRGVAHDEIIPLSISNGKLQVNGETSDLEGGPLNVAFLKGTRDNPKVNAIYLMKGGIDDVPHLPALPNQEKETDDEEDEDEVVSAEKKPSKSVRPSGPKTTDPYANEDSSSMLLPVLAAVAAFLPLLFCLCKL